MASESVQIKQEPLEQYCAAEMENVDADSAGCSSVNIDGSFDIKDIRAWSQSKVLNTADLHSNIIIKEEPNFYEDNCGDMIFGNVNVSNELKSNASMPENVQIKAEPEDDSNYATNNFNTSANLPQYTNDTSDEQKQLHNLSYNFQVLGEHENIITVTAADISPDDAELAFIQKLKPKPIPTEVKRPKKSILCKLCMKRYTEDTYYTHHMEQHRRNRIFCVRKTCDSWFSSMEECEAHEYKMHDLDKFECNVCNHKFLYFEQMCQHKEKMHGKLQRFVCSICRDWFISTQELHEHWESLLDRCGRIVKLLKKNSDQSLNLLQDRKPQIEYRNSYKIKSCGLKLKIKPTLDNNMSQGITAIHHNGIKSKSEQVDYEAVIPDFSLKQNTEYLKNNEMNGDKVRRAVTIINGLPISPRRLRLRKFPLSSTTSESENDIFTSTVQQNKRNLMGQALAQRITSKFSLKSVPKMFKLTNKIREDELENTSTSSLATETPNEMRETETNTIESITNTTSSTSHRNEASTKMLNLSTNFKIVKLSVGKPNLVKLFTSNSSPQGSNNTRSATTDIPLRLSAREVERDVPLSSSRDNVGRSFTLKEVEVPPLDKTAAVAKLESLTKTNTELSLPELLHEVIVQHKNNNPDTNVEMKQLVETNTEDIKKELDSERFEQQEQQNDDYLSTTAFSDCSLGSGGNTTGTNAIFQNDTDLPKRQKSQHSMRKHNRNKNKSTAEGFICPKCSRRYSTQAMVKEHLRNNCGRNPQNECDICHKCFFSTSTLNCHRTIHTGELPHKCNYCEKRFRTRGQVTVHHRTHTGERPFVCEICSQSFTHRETLISHLSRHIGMKRYKCYGCNKQFSCISGLSMHRSARPDTCGKYELNTRAIGPRVRVIRGRVVFEPQPTEPEDNDAVDENKINASIEMPLTEVLSEIQNK